MHHLYHRIYFKSEEADWVVFLHGIGGSSAIFYKQIKEFRKHFNLLLIDFPGHGRTPFGLKDMNKRTFDDIGECVLKVMDNHRIQKAHFVCISLGTIVGQVIAYSSSHRVKSLVLGGAVENFRPIAKGILSVANTVKNLVPYMLLYRISARVLMPKSRHKEARNIFVQEAKKLGKKEFLHWFHLQTEIQHFFSRLTILKKTTPKLYLMGSEDYMFLPYIRAKLQQAENEILYIIEKCGHVCNIEKPAEFNQKALSFIKSLS